MTRAEEAGLKVYPPQFSSGERFAKRVQGEMVDTHRPIRTIFMRGYEQAEKDLELTWNDMQLIWQICDTINDTERRNTDLMCSSKAYFSEVLRRFNNAKEKQP